MRKATPATVLCSLLIAALGASGAGDEISSRARRVHTRAIVVDTHDDTTQNLFEKDFDIGKRNTRGHVDIPRMREGGMDALFFSIYMSASLSGPQVVKRALQQIDAVYDAARKYPRDLVMAASAADVRRAHKQGKIAALMGMEGGHIIDDDLGILRMYAGLGIRYLTLTHSRHTNWADSSGEPPKHDGLTEFGKEVVRELNRLGVMVDISHVSDKTFWDALEVSRAPLIASHSSCFALNPHPRNMKDEMIRALAKQGGVIQITYVDSFLSKELRDAEQSISAEREARMAELSKQFADDPGRLREERRKLGQEYRARLPKVSWGKIIEHIDHAVKVAGVDHVGLGSDFDGATMPEGMEDVSKLPKITEALLLAGYSEKDVAKILGGNLLRVMEQAEKVSRELQSAQKP